MKYYLGIDLGGTNIAAGVTDENYKIIAKASVKTKLPRSAGEVINDMASLARSVVEKAGVSFESIECVGVGSPGIVNKETGEIEYANNLKWDYVPLAKMLGDLLEKMVYIENDANAAAYGEFLAGSAKGVSSAVCITIGTGVGGGIIIDSKVYGGFNYCGAELGHSVIVYDGEPCTCGRRGCVEAYSSATALIRMTREVMEQNRDSVMWRIAGGNLSAVNGRTAFDGMRQGDRTSTELVDKYIRYLACAVANFINIFSPEIFVIGGGICHEGDTLLVPLRKYVEEQTYCVSKDRATRIVAATLGNDAGIIGAAFLWKM